MICVNCAHREKTSDGRANRRCYRKQRNGRAGAFMPLPAPEVCYWSPGQIVSPPDPCFWCRKWNNLLLRLYAGCRLQRVGSCRQRTTGFLRNAKWGSRIVVSWRECLCRNVSVGNIPGCRSFEMLGQELLLGIPRQLPCKRILGPIFGGARLCMVIPASIRVYRLWKRRNPSSHRTLAILGWGWPLVLRTVLAGLICFNGRFHS